MVLAQRQQTEHAALRVLAVEEYTGIDLGTGQASLSASDFRALSTAWAATTGRSIEGYFEFGLGRVRPTNWMGTLQGGDVVLQVAPRGSDDLAAVERTRLDDQVGEMLRLALEADTVRASVSSLSVGSRYEKAVEALCSLTMQARRQGVVRRYRTRDQRSRGLRGALSFPRQATAVADPGLFQCRWVELDEDVPENRLLKEALERARLRTHGALRRRVDEAVVELGNASRSAQPSDDYRLIRFDRLSDAHVRAIELARGLLQGEALGLLAGTLTGASEVVLMDSLFESFVGYLARRYARRESLTASAKVTGRYLGTWAAGPSAGRSVVELIPDVELRSRSEPVAIVDAKWKRLRPNAKGLGVSASDVHQMVAYCARLSYRRAVLIYPWVGSSMPLDDLPVLLLGSGAGSLRLGIGFIQLPWDSVESALAQFGRAVEATA